MRLDRMGSMHQSRLSFLRQFLRRFSKQNWKFNRDLFEINAHGVGRALYRLSTPSRDYTLVCFAHDLPDEMRSDRVIASAWDATFTLYDGKPSIDDINRLSQHVPYQEEGRLTQNELCLSRANRSVRLWDYVLNCLAEGKQPDLDRIRDVGYLMRTTAVYGSGKFGSADRRVVEKREEANSPFQLEMMTVYLIRTFVMDLIEHLAVMKNPETAVKLDSSIRRSFGVGNSTGLGMAPFLVKHPVLLNNWFQVRETALSRMIDLAELSKEKAERLIELTIRVKAFINSWNTDDDRQKKRIDILKAEWASIINEFTLEKLLKINALKNIFNISKNYSIECQELVVSLFMEIGGDLIDGLDLCLESTKLPMLYPKMRVHELADLIKKNFSWALKIDFSLKENQSRFWYVSEEKLEPRLGNRYEEEGQDLERPLDIAKRVCSLYADLESIDNDMIVAEFLIKYPEHRFIIRRIQTNAWAPYSEIHDNLIDEHCKPIDMLRCKLSFFGASKFDPKSDRWVRVNLFQGAPLKNELNDQKNDDWWMPTLEYC